MAAVPAASAAAVADGELARLPLVPLARIASYLSARDVAALAMTCRGLRDARGTLRAHSHPFARPVHIESGVDVYTDEQVILLGHGGRYALCIKNAIHCTYAMLTVIIVHDLEHNRVLRRIDVAPYSHIVAFVPGSATLFVARIADGLHSVIDAASGATVRVVAQPGTHGARLAVSEDATAFAWFDHHTCRLSVTRGDAGTPMQLPLDSREIVSSAAFNRNSTQLAGICGHSMLRVWDAHTGDLLHAVPCDVRLVNSFTIAYSSDGALLLVCANTGVILVNTETWEQNVIFKHPSSADDVYAVFRGDYVFLVSLYYRDHHTRIDVRLIHTLTLKPHRVTDIACRGVSRPTFGYYIIRSIAFARDGSRVWLSGCSDEMIELRTGRLAKYLAE